MVLDIEASKQSIAQARGQISEARSQTESLKSENQTIQDKLNSARNQINSQRGLRSGKDLNSALLRNKQEKAIQQTEEQLSEREKVIAEYENEISTKEASVDQYEQNIRDYEHRLEQQEKDREVTVNDVEQSLQMSLSPEIRNKIEAELKKDNYQYSDALVNRLNNVLNEKINQPEIIKIKDAEPLQTTISEPVYSVVHDARPTDFLGKLQDKTRGTGVVEGLTKSLIINPGRIISNPIKSIKSIVSGGIKTVGDTGLFLIGKRETPFASVGEIVRERPGYVTGSIAGELILAKGTSSVVRGSGNVVTKIVTKLDPRFRPVIETAEGSKVIKDVALKSGNIDIPLSERIPTQSLKEQAAMAGTTRNVISAARDLFGIVFKRTRNISKPIPNEAALTPETKLMLKQFDEGKLPSKDIPELNRKIIQESGSKGLLERSFFADPNNILRPSRLGLQKEKKANIIDILSGDVSTVKPKPQAILLEQQKIQKFPKKLADVEKSLNEGVPLTQSQQDRLLRWQLEKSGEFKPIGFITRESETTAFGGILKRESTPSVTIINGKRVPIIKASIVKPSGELSELISKGQFGKLTVEESARMNKLLKSESGFSYIDEAKPYYNPYKTPATISVTSVSPSYSEPKSSSVISPILSSPSKTPSSPSYSKPSYSINPISKPVSKPNYNPPSPIPEIVKSPQPVSKPNYNPPKKPDYPLIPNKPIKPPIYPNPRKRTIDKKISKLREILSKGYKTFVIKNKKKQYLEGIYSRGEAIRRGENVVLGNLSATFGVEESNSLVKKGIEDYKVRSDIFRDYRIKKNARIGLNDMWIQKAGTKKEGFTRQGARLASIGEIEELRNKRKIKWL